MGWYALVLALLRQEVTLLTASRWWSPEWLLPQLLLLEGDIGS
jgi:hypothetical protein